MVLFVFRPHNQQQDQGLGAATGHRLDSAAEGRQQPLQQQPRGKTREAARCRPESYIMKRALSSVTHAGQGMGAAPHATSRCNLHMLHDPSRTCSM